MSGEGLIAEPRAVRPTQGHARLKELMPEAAIDRAFELARGAGLLLVVGSSLEVAPVGGLPNETLAAGGALAIVNHGPTPSDGLASIRIDGGAGEILAALARLLRA